MLESLRAVTFLCFTLLTRRAGHEIMDSVIGEMATINTKRETDMKWKNSSKGHGFYEAETAEDGLVLVAENRDVTRGVRSTYGDWKVEVFSDLRKVGFSTGNTRKETAENALRELDE